MSVDNKGIGCPTLDDFNIEFGGTESLFITEGKTNDWFIWHFSCKVSLIKIFSYLLELNIVFFASVGWDDSSY